MKQIGSDTKIPSRNNNKEVLAEQRVTDKMEKEVREWLENLGFSKTASFIIFHGMANGSVSLKTLVEKSGYSQPAISQRSIHLEKLGILERKSLPRKKGIRIELKPMNELIHEMLFYKFEQPLEKLAFTIREIKNSGKENVMAANHEQLQRLENYIIQIQKIVQSIKNSIQLLSNP